MIVFIIVAVISDSYIIQKIISRKETIGKQVIKMEKCSGHLRWKSILVSTIIIATFIIFTVIPNFTHTMNKKISTLPTDMVDRSGILFPVGFIVDPVVNIFIGSVFCQKTTGKKKSQNRGISCAFSKV